MHVNTDLDSQVTTVEWYTCVVSGVFNFNFKCI